MSTSENEGHPLGCGIVSRPRTRSEVVHRNAARLRAYRAQPAFDDCAEMFEHLAGEPADYAVAPSGKCAVVDVDRLADELAEVERRVEMVECESGRKSPELRDKLAEVGAALIDARFEPDDASAALVSELAGTIETLNIELFQVQRRWDVDRRELKSVRARKALLEEALNAAKRGFEIERSEVVRLEELNGALEEELRQARSKLSAEGAVELKRLQCQSRDYQLVISDLRKRMIAQNEEVEELRIDNDLLRAELSDTQALLRATHKELVSVCDELEDTQRQIDEAERFAWDAEKRAEEAEKRADEAAEDAFIAEQHSRSSDAETELMESWMNRALERVAVLEKQASRSHLRVVA